MATTSSEFEFLGQVTIGRYFPAASRLHDLDPRFKVAMAVIVTTAVIASSSIAGLTLLVLAVIVAIGLAHVPLRFALAGLRPVLPFLVLLALLQVLLIPPRADSAVLWNWRFVIISYASIKAGIVLLLRFAAMFLALSLLSFTTTTNGLAHGVEHLLRPLQRLGLPAHEFALTVNIVLRFIPILAEEAERLIKAQASRGADFGRRPNLVQRVRSMLPLLVPLFIAALQRAEELIEAMEARCYLGGKGRTFLIQFRAAHSDYLALATTLLVALAAVGLSLFRADDALWHWLISRL